MTLTASGRDDCLDQPDNPSLWTVTVTELARMRRGFLPLYILLAPIVIAVPLYLGSLFSPEGASGRTWEVFSNVTLEFWGVLVPHDSGTRRGAVGAG